MARIRSLKPEIWEDEKFGPLGPLEKLVFIGLISLADDAGRLLDNVRSLDAKMFPYTQDTVREALANLSRAGLVVRGKTSSGQRVVQVKNWGRHQRVDHPNLRAALPEIVVVNGDSEVVETVASHSREIPETFPSGSRDDLRSTTNDQRPTTVSLAPDGAEISTGSNGKGGKATSWPGRLAQVWTEAIGTVSPAHIGKELKPLVDRHGEEAIAEGIRRYGELVIQEGRGRWVSPRDFGRRAVAEFLGPGPQSIGERAYHEAGEVFRRLTEGGVKT